jgi:predicted transcriptional regulator
MNTETAVLDRFLEPVRQCLTPALARQLVDFRVDRQIQARVDELADKCNKGALSPPEQAEYEAIVEEADLIALLQAKARAFLANAES